MTDPAAEVAEFTQLNPDAQTAYRQGVNAAMIEVCAALRECGPTAESLYLHIKGRVERLEVGDAC